MDCSSICLAIEQSPIGSFMRFNAFAFPVAEAIHVIAVVMVFGTIFIVDLRLLGLPSTRWSMTGLAARLLKWTWGAFVLAVITGGLMFASTAVLYSANTFFRLKMLALILAGMNMFIFEIVTARSMKNWDRDTAPPLSAKIAGLLSILLWVSVILFGRWIGFTKTVAVQEIDFGTINSSFF